MSKVRIKGKKVIGSNSKDKITWLNKKSWKKGLNVYANSGNDIINFSKSKYNNKIYGGKGNDIITAGSGKNTIYFNKGDGKDTVLNGKGIDTLLFSKESKKTLKAKISGKNIILSGKNGKNTVILKNYLKTGHSATYVIAGKKKLKIDSLFPVKNINSQSGSIKGTQLRDKITSTAENAVINSLGGDDTINVSGGNFTINTGKGDDVINLSGSAKGTVLIDKGSGNLVINGIENAINNIDQHTFECAVTLKSDAVLQKFHNKYYISGKSVGDNFILSLNGGGTLTVNNMMKLEGSDLYKSLGIYCNEDDFYKILVVSNPLISMFIGPGTTVLPVPLLVVEQPNIIDMGNRTYLSANTPNTYISALGNLNRTIDINSENGALYIEGTGTHNINILSDSRMFLGEFCGKNNVNINASITNLIFYENSENVVNINSSSMSFLSFNENTKNTVTFLSEASINQLVFYGADNTVTTSGENNAIYFNSNDLTKQNIINANGEHDFIYNSGNTLIDFTGNINTNTEQVYVQKDTAITEILGAEKIKKTIIQYYDEASEFVYSHYYNQYGNNSVEGDDYIILKAFDENGILSTGETKIWGKWSKDDTDNIRFNLESMTNNDFTIHVNGGESFTISQLAQYIDMTDVQNDNTLNFSNSNDILSVANKFYVQGTTGNDTYTISNLNKTYIISENGGSNDTLIINQDKSDFIFFFDVRTNGNFGDDLYIISTTGGDSSEFSKFIRNEDANFICIKDAGSLSSAEVDKIRTTTQEISNYGAYSYISDIKASVANWLNAYNTNQNKNYASVMEAIKDGKGSDSLIALYTTNAETNWNNRWYDL